MARRGGGGLVTALRSLVSHHEVTWIASAMTEEDAAVAEEAGGAVDGDGSRRLAVPAAARRARPHGLRLVLQRRLEPDALVPPALPVGPRRDAERRPGARPRLEGGLRRRQRGVRRGRRRPSSRPSPTRASSSTTTTSTSRRGSSASARPDATLAHFVHIPWPQPDYWHALPRSIRAALHDGLLANDIVGFHTHRWRRNFLRTASDLVGAHCDFERGVASYDGRETLVSFHPISVDPCEFEELATSEAVLDAGAGDRRLAARVPRPPRRPHRPVEERRPRLPGVRALPRRPPGDARARRDAGPARPVPAGHPRVRGVPRRDPADGARRQRPLPAARLDADRPPGRGQLPPVGRGVQAVRRAARERDLRRHEPGREGGAARERARRRAPALRERRRPRRARRLGADGEPVRHLRPGAGDPPRARRCRCWSGSSASRAFAPTSGSTT